MPRVSGKNCKIQWSGQKQKRKKISGSNGRWTCMEMYVRKLLSFLKTLRLDTISRLISCIIKWRQQAVRTSYKLTCRCTNMVITFFVSSNGDSSPGKELFMVKPTSIHSTTAAWKQSTKEYLRNVHDRNLKKKERDMSFAYFTLRTCTDI